MKKLAIISAIAMSSLVYSTANAQIGIHIGIHFPHLFAPRQVEVVEAPVYQQPVVNDDDCDDYYYLPDVGAYYSITDNCYYYQDGDQWVSADYLPGVYHDFDWRYARHFEVRENRPYMRNDFYRSRYQGFDRNIAHNHDNFRGGFDYRHNNYAYYNDHHFDNRGNDQRFDNRGNDQRFDNRGGDDHKFDNRGNDQNFGFGQNNANNRGGNDQRFDNRGGNDPRFDNRGGNNQQFSNRGGFNQNQNNANNRGGQQNNQNQNQNRGGNNGQQRGQDNNNRNNDQRFAQNMRGYDGHH